MRKLRSRVYKGLMILAFAALPGADIECEDGEFEFNWPDIDWFDHDGGYWYYEEWYEEPCCGWWW